jgi:hypothetical protein
MLKNSSHSTSIVRISINTFLVLNDNGKSFLRSINVYITYKEIPKNDRIILPLRDVWGRAMLEYKYAEYRLNSSGGRDENEGAILGDARLPSVLQYKP